MEDDWDLQAVVRSCSAAASSSTIATTNTIGCGQVISPFNRECSFSSSNIRQDLFEDRRGNSIEELLLHDLYKPFFPKSQTIPISPLFVRGGLQEDLSYEQNQQQEEKQQQLLTIQLPQQTRVMQKQQQSLSVVVNGSTTKAHNPNLRSKKRKNNIKRVCHVAAESLSSDTWSWRKYGQKPIKGSPYPRGYYKCSTSKGCMARKQVERNRSDPGMFIVTYTAEHNHPMPTHRNTLAGSTRLKQAEIPNSDDPNKPLCSPEISPAERFSPAVEKLESSGEDLAEAEDDDDDFSISKMGLDDDFFTGLEDFTASECFSGHFPATSPLPWLGTTTTG